MGGVYLAYLLINLRFLLSLWDCICDRKGIKYAHLETVGGALFNLHIVKMFEKGISTYIDYLYLYIEDRLCGSYLIILELLVVEVE